MYEQREAYHQETENNGSCFLGSGTSAMVWPSASGKKQTRTNTHVGVQTNGLHGGGIVGIGAVAQGLPTAAKTTTERAVAVRIVHHRSLVTHYRKGRWKGSSEVVRDVGRRGWKERRGMGGYGDDEPLFKRSADAYDTCRIQHI